MRVFVASPYRGATPDEREANAQTARELVRFAVLQGHAAFAPHLLYPGALNEDVEEERDAGIRAGLSFLSVCTELWFFWGPLGITTGMRKELEVADILGTPTKAVFREGKSFFVNHRGMYNHLWKQLTAEESQDSKYWELTGDSNA